MSKVNQIQNELKSIDGGSFQKLCDLYLMQYPQYANLKPIGSVVGKDKTKTGVPDSLITLPDGTFALAHYTTQESGLPGKLKADFDSSFDEAHTGVPVNQIKEILFCHNGTLDTKDELSLIKEGRDRGATVRFYGLEKIAYDLFDKYPALASEFLHVEVDTGQIVPPQEFVSRYGKSSLSTRLDTAFHFREEELKTILDALKVNDLVFVTGSAGVGKSRLMLEAGYRFSSTNEGWMVLCVFNRGADLSQDIKTYFKRPGKYLILVDDANRLNGFASILQLLHDQTAEVQIKIVVTVRDYAREKVMEQAAPYGGGREVQLKPFSGEQIRTLISDEEDIRNHHFLTRISDIARGNPRLAMMAAKLVHEHKTLDSISDVTVLYDEYFGSVRQNLEDLGDERAVRVAGIVAFFRVVDRSNYEIMDAIAQAFDIPPSVFWQIVEQLDRLELVDLYENEIAKFSDQVLATYLFYVAVFKSGVLDFSILMDRFFPRHRSLFIDALNPVINSLGARIGDQLRPHIDRKWKALVEEGREEDLIVLIQVFWFVKQTDTLLYIREETKKLPAEQVDIDTLDFQKEGTVCALPLLDLLGAFYGTSHCNTALDLVLEIFARNARSLPNVLHILKKSFGFRPDSALLDFAPQRGVIDRLVVRTENGRSSLFSKLFLAVAKYYLRTEFEFTESKAKLVVSFVRFTLPSTPTVRSLRQSIWQHVFSLYSVPEMHGEVLGLLHDYSHSGYQVAESELLLADSEVVIPFMMTSLDPNEFKHVSTVQDYLGLLDREGVAYDPAVRERFTNQASRLADLLLIDRFHRAGRDFQEEETRRTEALRTYVKDFSVEDYNRLLRQCVEIQSSTPDSDKWELQRSIGKLFAILEERGPDFYAPVVTIYLELGSPFGINGRQVAYNLIRFYGVASAYETISSREYPDRIRWLFDFFASIPPEQVDRSHLDQLYDLYRTAAPNDLPNDFEFLERYMPFDEHIVVRVVEILLSRMEQEQDNSFAFRLSFLFNPYATTSEKLLSYFGAENIDLLKKAYLVGQTARDHSDYDGRVFSLILDLDKGFLREYLSLLVAEAKGHGRQWLSRVDDSKDFSFLWRREDFQAVTREALEFLYGLKQSEDMYVDRYLQVLFGSSRGDEPKESDATERQATMLRDVIAERATDAGFMEFVFEAVGGLPEGRRRDLLSVFLRNNTQVEDFKRLSLEPMSGGWSGSAVPYFQKKLEFAESLLPLVEGLDFLEHRFHIEKWIEGLQRQIEREKRSDFMEEV